MSNPITAKYTDPLLNSIRATLKSRNDNIPFLMLPVRLETRFMTVEKSLFPETISLFERLLEQFGNINIALLDLEKRLLVGSVAGKYNEVTAQLKALNTDLQRNEKMTAQEINWLKQQAAITLEKGQEALRKFKQAQSKKIRDILKKELELLSRRMSLLSKTKDDTYAAGSRFIDKLKYFDRKWSNIGRRKMPYANPNNKRRLYIYLKNSLREISGYYEMRTKAVEDIKAIRKNQIDQIELLMQGLLKKMQKAPKKLQSLFTDDNWNNFVKGLSTEINTKIKTGAEGFASEILIQLHFLEKYKPVAAGEIYFKGIQTLIDLKRFNGSDPRGYKDIKKSRKKLDHRVRSLATMTNQVVSAHPDQVERIQHLWEKLNPALDQYQKKLGTVKNLNKSQKFGIDLTVKYVATSAKNAISGLNIKKPKEFTYYNSQEIQESVHFFLTVENEVQQLQKSANALQSRNTSKERLELFANSLEETTNKFKIASRKNIVLPKADYEILQHNLSKTKTAISNMDASDKSIFTSSIAKMEATVANDFSSIPGKLANPLEILEKPPILVSPTKTENELWLRIFPDDIHVHTHEEKLTENEERLGKLFWTNYWAASQDKNMEMAAWRKLRLGLGVKRAAWVAKQLIPQEHQFRNKRPFFENTPSEKIRKVIGQLKEIQTLLKSIKEEDTYAHIETKIDSQNILAKLTKVFRTVEPIKKEQAYFLQKSITPLKRLEGALYLIQEAVEKLDQAEMNAHSASLLVVQDIFQMYTEIRSSFAKINGLSFKDFVTETVILLTFPPIAIKEEDWTVAPHTRTLPDRFVAITIQKNKFKHIVVGDPITDHLQLGLDPKKFGLENVFQLDEEKVDEGMQWMTDYKEAVKVGMGISISLSKEEAAEGFDKVLVLGIKDTSPSNARTLLEKLFENHQFSADGMSILKNGTPTNNTDKEKAGFKSVDENDEESFRVEMSQQLFEKSVEDLKIKDGQRLAKALGIQEQTFYNIENSDKGQIANAKAMNHALWNATVGYSMNEIWDSIFTYDNIDRTQEFFTKYVFGRGNLPVLRIGAQPYGILTTTAFSRLRHTKNREKDILPALSKANFDNPGTIENQLQLRYDIRLQKMLASMNLRWSEIRSEKVKHLDNVKGQNPQQHFMDMLGLNATTVDYFFRYGVNIAMRGADNDDLDFNVNFKDETYAPIKLRTFFNDLMADGYFYNSFDFYDETSPDTDEIKQKTRHASRIQNQFSQARAYKNRFLEKHVLLNGEVIDAAAPSETTTLAALKENGDTYIDWLLKNSLFKILASNQIEKLPSNSLLFLLLRQALMSAYNYAALKVLQKEDFFKEDYSKAIGSPRKYRVFDSKKGHYTYNSSWTFLIKDVNRLEGLDGLEIEDKPLYKHLNLDTREKSMADYLLLNASGNPGNLFTSFSRSNLHEPHLKKVKEVWHAIKHLNTLPTAELGRLLTEHIDLCTYRLDAWILGQSNKRLEDQRTTSANGIYLGAYGWVENLRPGGDRKEATNLPDALTKKGDAVYTDEDNEGFIHAPSINQSIAAAVLRSGYIANSAEEDLSNTMAVNLSSARVRMALNLLDGVRNGLEVGAVLGFQFERGLHERYDIAELDKFIQPFRKKFKLAVPIEEAPENQETTRETNVVNGMTLLDKVNEAVEDLAFENDSTLFELLTEGNFANCPPWLRDFVIDNGGDTNDLRVIIAEIDRMANAFDAIGDLALSESVYQIVQGNHVRAAAMVTALAEGKNPPVPQVIDTPRSGTVVTQRVVMNLKPISTGENAQPKRWKFKMTERALAEPSLNNWLGDLLGNPNKIRCMVSYLNNGILRRLQVRVTDLELQPIDFFYLMSASSQEGSSELNEIVAHFVRRKKNLNVSVELHLKFKERNVNWNNTIKSFYEIQPLLYQIKTMLNDALPLSATELSLPPDRPEQVNPGGINLIELKSRVTDAQVSQQELANTIRGLISVLTMDSEIESVTFSKEQLIDMKKRLFQANEFGVPNSIPDAAIEANDEIGRDQLRQLVIVNKNLEKRLAKVSVLKEGLNDDTPIPRKVETYREMAKSLFGKQFILLPQYTLNNLDKIKEQLVLHKTGKGLLRASKTDFPMEEWLQSLGEVREKMYATEMAGMLVDTLGQSFPDLIPVQFPFKNNADHTLNDHWLGIEYPESYQPDEDKLSIVLMNAKFLFQGDANAMRVGFIVDEWMEIIPHATNTTGLAFHYDQPDATAPQSLLLAVSPQETGSWEWDDLLMTLVDTLKLAKNRAVEPDHLENTVFAQTLPAILSEVVPPQVRADMETEGQSNPLGAQVVLDFADNLKETE